MNGSSLTPETTGPKRRADDLPALQLTPHPEWARRFWAELTPIKDRIAGHNLFVEMAEGRLPVARFRHALLNFYPLVAHFPHYMSLNLARAHRTGEPGVLATRDWLINNIRIEQRHLYWYRDWAQGFGIDAAELDAVRPPPAMDAVNYYLWHINERGSLAEAIAATNIAIEWATGDWSAAVVKGMRTYARRDEARIDRRSMAWLRAHAHYDDRHPHEAMELVKLLCTDDASRRAAFLAAERGMSYYLLALDACWQTGGD